MLCDLFRRLRFHPMESYQYIGFGSVAFIDFRLVHRALGISTMVSIEGTEDPDEQTRFERNKPYEAVEMKFGHSADILPTLNFATPSLVWLDYDDLLIRGMATDLGTVALDLASGSFLGVTFTADFPTGKDSREKALSRYKEQFPEFLADDAKAGMFDGLGIARFGSRVLGALLQTALDNADAGKDPADQRRAHQVCFFTYRDGAPMATVGWIVAQEGDRAVLGACSLEALPFYRAADDPFRIKMPLVTPLEIHAMERALPDLVESAGVQWIPLSERQAFSEIYRYLPHFAALEAA